MDTTLLLDYHKKISVHRNVKQEGLIRSRNYGAKIASGNYIIFLDSHCEVNVQWLEPLLDRARLYPGSVVCPIIDIINPTTFKYRTSAVRMKGGFNWALEFRWIPLSEREKFERNDTSMEFP